MNAKKPRRHKGATFVHHYVSRLAVSAPNTERIRYLISFILPYLQYKRKLFFKLLPALLIGILSLQTLKVNLCLIVCGCSFLCIPLRLGKVLKLTYIEFVSKDIDFST